MSDPLVHGPALLQGNNPGSGPPPAMPNPASLKMQMGQRQSQNQTQSQSHGPFGLVGLVRYAGNRLLSLRDGRAESEREKKRSTEERMKLLAIRMQNVRFENPFLAAPSR